MKSATNKQENSIQCTHYCESHSNVYTVCCFLVCWCEVITCN